MNHPRLHTRDDLLKQNVLQKLNKISPLIYTDCLGPGATGASVLSHLVSTHYRQETRHLPAEPSMGAEWGLQCQTQSAPGTWASPVLPKTPMGPAGLGTLQKDSTIQNLPD